MRIPYLLFVFALLVAFWSLMADIQSQGQQRGVIQASPTFKVPLSQTDKTIINNLKPGQVAVKTVIFAPDKKTANTIGKCCPKGKCCCSCQCEPKPCICTCTDEIVVK